MNLPRSPWLVRQSGAGRRLRLYCFCYAGGSAANYASWQAELDPAIEICAIELPGRGRRFGEEPQTSLAAVTATVAKLIASQGSMPFAFFGHSLGALLAFEVARYLHHHGLPTPRHLFLSGASAPQHRRKLELHLLADDALIEELKRYNGTPLVVLEHRELMELLLPVIRADFALAGNYAYRPGALLNMSMTVLMGREDKNGEGEHVEGWKKETSGDCRIAWFDGDHFFIHPQRAAVFDCIRSELLGVACT
ncbi:thioesterase II family protein [Duganella violaceipulchra]|uniref:Alpha/beta fold hydrolase n=1 Tax=Duganella violaceipulchra TaxID=2849652 RepID=A0AA41HF41_9BURK|nr:alpha/beta fold hydrolase [Duganella violaceicalia]MBV6325546.1 alpha/beta fold hydrolase [Duganella violaceicalia]MCP2012111.1 medium-chain acyl-[acyl-carrier-protein] hydrolase [Duganella violaceicalia]